MDGMNASDVTDDTCAANDRRNTDDERDTDDTQYTCDTQDTRDTCAVSAERSAGTEGDIDGENHGGAEGTRGTGNAGSATPLGHASPSNRALPSNCATASGFYTTSNEAPASDESLTSDEETGEYIPGRACALLPPVLAGPAACFDDRRKRDVFLTGALPIWAGALSGVRFRYGGSDLSPNLYSAVIAPPASGKSALRHARAYGTAANGRSADGGSVNGEPMSNEPGGGESGPDGTGGNGPRGSVPGRHLFLAADTSAAALKRQLSQNPHGVICETEFQALARALSSSWGKFTDLLLKGFQNETVRARRASHQPLTIGHPAPSIALSGTPSAFEDVISGTDDGLFSRFLLYRFDADLEWTPQFGPAGGPSSQKGPSGKAGLSDTAGPLGTARPPGQSRRTFGPASDPLQARLENGASRYRALRARLSAREEPLLVRVPPPLRKVHTQVFESITRKWKAGSVPRSLWPSLTRTGLQAVKIASILRVLRSAGDTENGSLGESPSSGERCFGERRETVALTPADMEAGLRLALTYLLHAIQVEDQFGSDTKKTVKGGRTKALRAELTKQQEEYLELLPETSFSTSEAKARAPEVEASPRTVQRWLRKWVESGLLTKKKRGTWKKPSRDRFAPTGAQSIRTARENVPTLADAF